MQVIIIITNYHNMQYSEYTIHYQSVFCFDVVPKYVVMAR